MNATARLNHTGSQTLAQGCDPYNTADALARQREIDRDFADWVREIRAEEAQEPQPCASPGSGS